MTNLVPIENDDGWDDAAAENAERVIKGTLLRFNDWRWTKGKEGTEVEEGTALVALGTAAAWVKWRDGKPIEYVMRQPGKKLPDRDELSDPEGCGTWEIGPTASPRTHGRTRASSTSSTRSVPKYSRSPHPAGVVARLSMIWPSKFRGYVTGNQARRPWWSSMPILG